MRKTGSSVFQSERGQVFGVEVDLYLVDGHLALSKRGAQDVIQHCAKLGGLTDRQSRAAVSSYCVEGWTLPSYCGGLNEPIFAVNSFEWRVLEHLDRRVDSRIENGRKGGRPAKPAAWDVTPGSGIKQRQVIETQVAAEHERL